jgi:hypothetical protein
MRWREIGRPQTKRGDGTKPANLRGRSNDAPTQQRPVRPTDKADARCESGAADSTHAIHDVAR